MELIESAPVDMPELAECFKVLAEPKRLLILHLLMEGARCNCELGNFLDMSPNLVSHHLRLLREADLVEIQHDPLDARWVHYSINWQAVAALRQAFDSFFDSQSNKPYQSGCGQQPHFLADASRGS